MSRKTAIAALFALAMGCEARDRDDVTETRTERIEVDEEASGTARPSEAPTAQNDTYEEAPSPTGSVSGTNPVAEQPPAGQEIAQNTAEQDMADQNTAAQNMAADQNTAGGNVAGQEVAGQDMEANAAEPAVPPPSGTMPEPQPAERSTTGEGTQLVTREAEGTLTSTVASLQRQLRANDFEVIEVVRYDADDRPAEAEASDATANAEQAGADEREADRAAAADESTAEEHAEVAADTAADTAFTEETEAMTNEEIGDVRLILYRRPEAENALLGNGEIATLLSAPRQIAVFERGDGVVIAYNEPVMDVTNEGEPIAQVLDRIVVETITPAEAGERTASLDRNDMMSDEVSEDETVMEGEVYEDQTAQPNWAISGPEEQRMPMPG